jgi:serine protease Do
MRGGARAGLIALLCVLGALLVHLAGLPSPLRATAARAATPAATTAAASPRPAVQPAPAETLPDLAAIERQFQALAQRVSPSVVAICGADSANPEDATQRAEDLNPDHLARTLDAVDRTVGTGLIVDADGYILTNDHVVGHAEQLWVTTDDKKVYPAIIVGSDPRSDLALLKIPATRLPPVKFAEPSRVRRGQWAVAIGSPYGLASEGEMCMAVGVVSALGRSLPKLSGKEDRLYSDLIQTTAQINPGNSGGPLFDLSGQVIGINTAVILPQKQTNGIGFALPITPRLLQTVEDLKQGREIVYAYMGAHVMTPSLRERREAGVEAEYGALIDDVDPQSPAAAAGLKTGDLIVRVNNELMLDSDHFIRYVGASAIGTPIPVKVYRNKQLLTPKVTLTRRKTSVAAVTRESRRFRWRGLLLGPVPANWQPAQSPSSSAAATASAAKKITAGLMVIGIDPASPMLKQQGLKVGSVITSVAKHAIADVTEFQRIINDTPPEQCSLEIEAGADATAQVASSDAP